MLGILVQRIVTSAETFARCVRAELDAAGTGKEMRQQLATLFDNALVRYAQQKPDATTQAVVRTLRPRMRRWWGAAE
jgi:hypothetical protein